MPAYAVTIAGFTYPSSSHSYPQCTHTGTLLYRADKNAAWQLYPACISASSGPSWGPHQPAVEVGG